MSVKVMAIIWDNFDGGGGELLTALALADHADHEGGSIFPAVRSVAKKTRQSERTVQRHIQTMLQSDWLRITHRSFGRGQTICYRIPIERVSNSHPSGKGDTADTLNGGQLCAKPMDNFKKGDIHDTFRVTSTTKKGDTAMSPESSVPIS
jgi:hypothetical protein